MTPADFDALRACVQFVAHRLKTQAMDARDRTQWRTVVKAARAALRRLQRVTDTPKTGTDA